MDTWRTVEAGTGRPPSTVEDLAAVVAGEIVTPTDPGLAARLGALPGPHGLPVG
jgi:hypothetical protein